MADDIAARELKMLLAWLDGQPMPRENALIQAGLSIEARSAVRETANKRRIINNEIAIEIASAIFNVAPEAFREVLNGNGVFDFNATAARDAFNALGVPIASSVMHNIEDSFLRRRTAEVSTAAIATYADTIAARAAEHDRLIAEVAEQNRAEREELVRRAAEPAASPRDNGRPDESQPQAAPMAPVGQQAPLAGAARQAPESSPPAGRTGSPPGRPTPANPRNRDNRAGSAADARREARAAQRAALERQQREEAEARIATGRSLLDTGDFRAFCARFCEVAGISPADFISFDRERGGFAREAGDMEALAQGRRPSADSIGAIVVALNAMNFDTDTMDALREHIADLCFPGRRRSITSSQADETSVQLSLPTRDGVAEPAVAVVAEAISRNEQARLLFRDLLENNGSPVSLRQLEIESGIPNSTLSRYRSGRTRIGSDRLGDLLFGLSHCGIATERIAPLGSLIRPELPEEWFRNTIEQARALEHADPDDHSGWAPIRHPALWDRQWLATQPNQADISFNETSENRAAAQIRRSQAALLFGDIMDSYGIELDILHGTSGISPATLSRYSSGQRPFNSDRLGDLLFGLEHCGVTPEHTARLGTLARPELTEEWFRDRIEQARALEHTNPEDHSGWAPIRHPALWDRQWLATQPNQDGLLFGDILLNYGIELRALTAESGVAASALSSYSSGINHNRLNDVLFGLSHCDVSTEHIARLGTLVRPELTEEWFRDRIEQARALEHTNPEDHSGWAPIRYPALWDRQWLATHPNQAGQVLAELRSSLGLNQDDLAQRAPVSVWALQAYENDANHPITPAILDRIINAMETVAIEQGTQDSFAEHAERLRALVEARMATIRLIPGTSTTVTAQSEAEQLPAERRPPPPRAGNGVAGGEEAHLPTDSQHGPSQETHTDEQPGIGG